jgi:hypothetical protein
VLESRDKSKKRGFAATGWTQKRKKLILENSHRDIIERFDLLSCVPRKDLRDVGNVDSYGAFHVELQQVLVKFRELMKKIR